MISGFAVSTAARSPARVVRQTGPQAVPSGVGTAAASRPPWRPPRRRRHRAPAYRVRSAAPPQVFRRPRPGARGRRPGWVHGSSAAIGTPGPGGRPPRRPGVRATGVVLCVRRAVSVAGVSVVPSPHRGGIHSAPDALIRRVLLAGSCSASGANARRDRARGTPHRCRACWVRRAAGRRRRRRGQPTSSPGAAPPRRRAPRSRHRVRPPPW